MAEVFGFLLLLATTTSLFMYLACALAALRLAARGDVAPPRALPLIAVLGAAYAIWTIYGAGGEAVGWGVALLVAGVPIYALMNRRGEAPRPMP